MVSQIEDTLMTNGARRYSYSYSSSDSDGRIETRIELMDVDTTAKSIFHFDHNRLAKDSILSEISIEDINSLTRRIIIASVEESIENL